MVSASTSPYDLTAARLLFAALVARVTSVTHARRQLRLVRSIYQMMREMIALEHVYIARERRAKVLASPALRRAAFAAIGLDAILRWEAAWRQRKRPVKQVKYPSARRSRRASVPKTAADYALMPLPKRDYGPRHYRVRDETAALFAPPSMPIWQVKPLPPAYLYPHEICDRPVVWARVRYEGGQGDRASVPCKRREKQAQGSSDDPDKTPRIKKIRDGP